MNILSNILGITLMASVGLIAPPEPLQAPQAIAEVVEQDLSTKEGIEAYIRSKDWDGDVAVAVATAESGLNIKAHNPEKHRGCAGSFSIMQVACIHFKAGEDPFDVKTNVDTAYRVYQEAGNSFRPWTVYTKGLYKKHL